MNPSIDKEKNTFTNLNNFGNSMNSNKLQATSLFGYTTSCKPITQIV